MCFSDLATITMIAITTCSASCRCVAGGGWRVAVVWCGACCVGCAVWGVRRVCVCVDILIVHNRALCEDDAHESKIRLCVRASEGEGRDGGERPAHARSVGPCPPPIGRWVCAFETVGCAGGAYEADAPYPCGLGLAWGREPLGQRQLGEATGTCSDGCLPGRMKKVAAESRMTSDHAIGGT